ncbi:hypothetical protein LWI28_004937 [Acer negundo]|uniref:Deoxyhypusine monooxygenase n=1 Tax=Acer negundo TaxID=4023 RepID=A0AAD5NT15_ACENE|nr:hypothetical protein LWI28_004937 [Acer negundo]
MKKKYEGNARVKQSILLALHKEFETLEMKSGEKVSDYFSRVIFVANRIRVHGERMVDVTIVEKILRSLTDKFNYIVCSIEESKDIDSLSIDELQSSLIVHEQKFHKHYRKEQALKVTHEDRSGGRGRGRCKGSFRGRGRCRVDLECGDNEGEDAISDVIEEDSERDNDASEVETVLSSNVNDMSSPSSNEGRSRRRPVWMDDYEIGKGFSKEDVANMVLFAFVDHVHFEEAVKTARDSSNLLAHEAAFAFGQMQDTEAIPALEAVLNDFSLHPIVRHEAAEALGAIGLESNIPILKNSLVSDPAQEVAYVLGQLQNKAASAALSNMLRDVNEHPMVRHEAAEALGSIANDHSVALLEEFARDPDPIVSESREVALSMLEYERSGKSFEAPQVQL